MVKVMMISRPTDKQSVHYT